MSNIRTFFPTLWKDERGAMIGLVGVFALAGWGLALTSMGSTGDLEEKLIASEANLSKAKMELSDISTELAATRETQEVAVSLGDMERQLAARRNELAARRNELVSLAVKINLAKGQLGDLRAGAKRQQDLAADAAMTYRTTTRAKVRAAPTTESNEVALVPSGTPLVVFDTAEDGTWYRVGRVGFMHRDLLKPASSLENQ